MIILYLAVLITALYFVVKMLLPEMAKPAISKIAPTTRAILRSKIAQKPNPSDFYQPSEAQMRIEKLETFLAEKNKNIQILQTELKIFHVQVRDFDKVKALLEGEIHRLREQNRIFRSELGLPANQPKESLTV